MYIMCYYHLYYLISGSDFEGNTTDSYTGSIDDKPKILQC